MNEEQNLAHGLAVNGHNLLLLGPAGTGKSYVVSEIYRTLTDSGVNVQITCSTGIACSVYTGLNPCTVHRYLGLEDGRYSPDRINDVHSNSGHYRYVFDNLRKVQCLIVDECSMISRHTFECIISVCKTKEEKLQLIFVGDFFQLPPVANLDYHDSGEFCFQSPYFSVFQHSVTLKKFHRTNDDQLLSAITDVFSGKLSPGSQDFILSMKRPLPPSRSAVSVKLFAKNDLVNDYNRTSLLNFPGDLYEYKSNDSGRVKELFKVTAPEILWIKLGCPVILLKNLTGKLVNGLMGHIQDINNKGLVVEFPSLHLTTTIERTNFTGMFFSYA